MRHETDINENDLMNKPMPAKCFQDEAKVFSYAEYMDAIYFYGYGDKSYCKRNFMGLPTILVFDGKVMAGGSRAKDCHPEIPVYAKAQVEAAIRTAQKSRQAQRGV